MKRLLFALLIGTTVCGAQAPQVPVTGSLGAGGVFPLVNSPAVVFTSDANHIMAYPEVSGSSGVLVVTSSVSLTATRTMIAPLMKGFEWAIKNATTGGQSIQIIGSSGSGVTIANGSTAVVFCDGTNYLSVGNTVYPPSGVPNSMGTSYGTSYQVGTSANNLVQLNGAGALPAVSGANLTNVCLSDGTNCTAGSGIGGALSSSNVVLGGAVATGSTFTVSGFDGTHTVTVMTNAAAQGSGVIYTLTFTATRGHISYCVVNTVPAGTTGIFLTSASATSYAISTASTLSPSTTYTFNVSCP